MVFRARLAAVGRLFPQEYRDYIQNTNQLVPFSDLNLPLSLLSGSTASPSELFNFTRSNNTPGGPLSGVEVNVQLPFRFLPGFLSNFGALANFTRVRSNINYILQTNHVTGQPTLADAQLTAPLGNAARRLDGKWISRGT